MNRYPILANQSRNQVTLVNLNRQQSTRLLILVRETPPRSLEALVVSIGSTPLPTSGFIFKCLLLRQNVQCSLSKKVYSDGNLLAP